MRSTVARLELKRIGGDPYKWWNMWFNAIVRAKPYQFLTVFYYVLIKNSGVAWLSSVRVVRCLVKSLYERNPFF